MDEQTPIEPSRSSTLNRTMIISKRASRPTLPMTDGSVEVDDLTSAVSEPIAAPAHLEAARVQMRSRSGDGRRGGRVRSATVTISSGSETIIEFTKAFDEIENQTNLTEAQKLPEARRKILAILDAKEKQWNSKNVAAPSANNENVAPNSQTAGKLELEITRRAALYADRFFKICERNEIDIEKLLKDDPETIFNMKLRAALPTPITSENLGKEIESLRAERDNLADESKSLKASYTNLFRSYDKLRTNYELLQESRNSLLEAAEQRKAAMTTIYESARSFQTIMTEQAAIADQSIAEAKGRYDNSTVTIRMDLLKYQNENSNLRSEIQCKDREIEELRRIITEVVKQVQLEVVE